MSPALAHRDPHHNKMIESMAEQMVELLLQEKLDKSKPEDSGSSSTRDETQATTKTGIARIGTWEKLEMEGETEEQDQGDVRRYYDHPTTGHLSGSQRGEDSKGVNRGGRVSAALSQSLALAQALAQAAPNPNSAANYQNSFGYVEPCLPPTQTLSQPHSQQRTTKEFTPTLDLSFSLQGSAMTRREIQFADRCNICFAAVLLLQRWGMR